MNELDTTFSLPGDWTPLEQQIWQELSAQVAQWRAAGQMVVLATGVFDLFHDEHRNFLERARAIGDQLVVGVESDARVRVLKGAGRPVQSQTERLEAVSALAAVSDAAILPEAFAQQIHYQAWAGLLCPAVLAVSSHSPFLENKTAVMAEFGGSVAVVSAQNPAVSTTLLLQQRTMNGTG